MVKDINTQQSKNGKLDFDQCKMKFREDTINIANDFAVGTCNIWLWLKKRLELTFEDGVVVSRQLNETKQKSYATSGASAIWNESSQTAIGIIRSYIPTILNKLPESKCENCSNSYRVYSAGLSVVENGWKQFWISKNNDIIKLKNEQQNAMLNLFRVARSKFKYTLSPSCYDAKGKILKKYHKDVFFPELVEQIDRIYNTALTSYIEIVINTLPEMVSCKSLCAGCHSPVKIRSGLT